MRKLNIKKGYFLTGSILKLIVILSFLHVPNNKVIAEDRIDVIVEQVNCLDLFHNGVNTAYETLSADYDYCSGTGGAGMCYNEANAKFNSSLGGYADSYGDCCDAGGSGC